jgi:hypothetical protein
MHIPAPREKLADCMWLPRILAKARGLQNGQLPAAYAARFCHPTGVDNQFLQFFSLNREDILSAATWPDERVAEWFIARTGPARIEQWNELAVNLGREGYPMTDRLQIGLSSTYQHLAGRGFQTIFEVLEADDQIT